MQQDRRHLLAAFAGTPMLAPLASCSPAAPYAAAAAETWRHPRAQPPDAGPPWRLLVHYATLAANGHNTQPWRFVRTGDRQLTIQPDPARRTPVVDPDDHHLWTSLGCATENLMLAAQAYGWTGEAATDEQGVHVELQPAPPWRTAWFDAIVHRQCTRGPYDGRPLPPAEFAALRSAASTPAVRVLWLTERSQIEVVNGFVARGVQAQMADAAFVDELKQWVRFSHAEAARHRDGLFSASSGNPALPRWLGSRAFDWFFTAEAEIERYAEHLRSSAGVVVFVAERADTTHWVAVGRCYERFALAATSLGIRNAFLNQPVEVPAVRQEFAAWLGLGAAQPDLVVRFGHGHALPPSLRRPVDAVIA